VCLVEPGDHRGGSSAYRGKIMPDQSAYEDAFRRGTAVIHQDETNGAAPVALGRKTAKVLSRRKMPFRLRVASADQHLAVYIHRLLPAWINEAVLRSYYLGQKGKPSNK